MNRKDHGLLSSTGPPIALATLRRTWTNDVLYILRKTV
jgi:hypothetical protein